MGVHRVTLSKNHSPIALRGPKWLQNIDLKIFWVLFRSPGFVQKARFFIEISGFCMESPGFVYECGFCIEISGSCVEGRVLYGNLRDFIELLFYNTLGFSQNVGYQTLLCSKPFPPKEATFLRSGHIHLIVRGQMYDRRMTIYTACYILCNVSNILCFSKYIQIGSLHSFTLKGRGYFINEKDGGGGIMAPTFISARGNGKRLIFSGYKSFVN